MILWFAFLAGAGMGLAFFSGLWLTIRSAQRRPDSRGMIVVSELLRMALAAAAFYALSRAGIESLLAGLVGLWVSRSLLFFVGGVIRVR